MSSAAAIDLIRGLISGALPSGLSDAEVVIGHPGAQEEYVLAINVFVLQLREDAAWRQVPGRERHTLVESDLLISAHAPPERGFDGIRLLELACEVVRTTPELGALAHGVTAEVLLRPVPLDQMAAIWRGLGTPMHPSLLCVVRVASDERDRVADDASGG
jgi:hypothetical protein